MCWNTHMFHFLPAPPVIYLLAAFAGCPAPASVATDVAIRIEDPVFIDTYSSVELAKMAQRKVFTHRGQEYAGTMGLIEGDLVYDYAPRFRMEKGQNGICLSLKDVRLTVSYSPKVYISSDHDSQGCSYAHIAKHERKHYDADVEILSTHVLQLEAELAKSAAAAGARGPMIEAAVETMENELRQAVAAAMQPLVDRIGELRAKRHAVYDSRAAYARDTKACSEPLEYQWRRNVE